MAEKTEYRLDEYREYENGEWGPWFKIDHRLFDDDPSSARLSTTREEKIYDEWLWGKIDNKYAWKELKKEKAALYQIANMDDINKLENRRILEHYEQRIKKAEEYIKEIEEKIKAENNQNTAPQTLKIPQEEIMFIKYIKDAGQIENKPADNGKYNLTASAENFIHWYIYNNYDRNENYKFLPVWIDKHINNKCTLESLKRYTREAKKIVPAQLQGEEKIQNIRENM